MFEDIKAIQKTNERTAHMLKALMNSGEFRNNNDAFVLLRATLKALRDRLEPHEAMHLGSQLPALLRGFYFEGYGFSQMDIQKSSTRNLNGFLSDLRVHLAGYDFMDLRKVVPLAMKVILDSIDQGEAIQVIHQLPKEIQELCPE